MLKRTCVLVLAALTALTGAAMAAPKQKVAVLALKAGKGVDPLAAEAVTDALVAAIQARGVQTITQRDISTALNFERDKRKLKVEVAKQLDADVCTDSESCLMEIGGALGVDRIVSGSLARLGSSALFNVQSFDTRKAVVERRHNARIKGEGDEAFLDGVEDAAQALFPAAEKPEQQRIAEVGEDRRSSPARSTPAEKPLATERNGPPTTLLGLSHQSTIDEVLRIFGQPYGRNEAEARVVLSYGKNGAGISMQFSKRTRRLMFLILLDPAAVPAGIEEPLLAYLGGPPGPFVERFGPAKKHSIPNIDLYVFESGSNEIAIQCWGSQRSECKNPAYTWMGPE